jgi:hypothetical protein
MAQTTARLQNDGVFDAYIEQAKTVCRNEGILLCDCYAKWRRLQQAGVDTTRLLANHINHPTRAMHELFATSLIDTLISAS